uniref:Transmembrane protein n=1 Tax=Steinernema glaseri TaxID=37863 RepID=A0A1I7ZM00_9BILA
MTRLSSVSHKRSRKERLLRYLLRRKPCVIITFIELALVVALGVSLFAITSFNRSLNEQVETLHREDVVWSEFHHRNLFSHCRYEKASEFNIEFCDNRCGPSAFMWRHYKLVSSNNDSTCLDRHEQMDCVDKASNYQCKTPKRTRVQQCPGVNGVKMPKTLVTSESEVIAPLLPDLSKLLGQEVLAQDLFALCPRCRVYSKPFYLDDQSKGCAQQLRTMRKGWPYYMELCDDIETEAVDSC